MTWHAPDVGHLVEDRLRGARLELMGDSRFKLAETGQRVQFLYCRDPAAKTKGWTEQEGD